MPESSKLPQFIAGGTVPPNSPVYTTRAFEDEVFEHLTRGDWVLVLGPRQHGKSSALLRLYERLQQQGFTCAFVDVQRYGRSEESSYESFLRWWAARVAAEIGVENAEPPAAGLEDLQSWLEVVLPAEVASVAILIDEVGGVPPAIRQRFFGQLRALYNERARRDAQAAANRTVFAFAGTFRPEGIIDTDNSPFNVSQHVYTAQLTSEQALELAMAGLGESGGAFGEQAFAAVGGQPYLLQRLLAAVQRADPGKQPLAFDQAFREISDGTDRHLPDLLRLVAADEALTSLVRRVTTESIPFERLDPDHMYGVVVGILHEADGKLDFASPVYREALGRLDMAAAGADSTEAAPECDVLLVTTTEVETAAVREVFSQGHVVHWRNNTYRELGKFGGAKTVLVRVPEMGASGVGGATLTINEAIDELKPEATILVGIAFGLQPDSQEIGDVLCATSVIDYELQRVGTGSHGELDVIDRGSHASTTPRLVASLQDAASETQRVVFGQVLSGDKLIDNQEFRDKLAARYPDAVGGDMEAVGLAAVAVRSGADWISVKGVCDWADGDKGRDKEARQRQASERAAQFVRAAIERGGVAL